MFEGKLDKTWQGTYFSYRTQSLIDKYGSKHTDSQRNIQAKIGGTYEKIRMYGVYIQEHTVGVYIREGKDIRRQIYEDSTFKWPNISLVHTNLIIDKTVLIQVTQIKLL